MTAPEQPVGPQRLDFTLLDEDDFEMLCHLVIALAFPEAVKLRAPDQGADSALPAGEDRAYARCWQAKRFTGHVSWGKCEDSLDAAVAAYGMPHYTFCFARDLTGNQEQTFRQRLVGRHASIRVDYWGRARLVGALLDSAAGQRIAHHFYGDPAHDTRALMQAFRAGGALETGADVGARLVAIAEWLASRDPFFSYPTSTREAHLPGPGTTPGAVMAVEEEGPEVITRVEAVPRNSEAMEEYGPEFAIMFEDSERGRRARAELQRSFKTGEQVTLREGVSLRFDRLPPLIEAQVSREPIKDPEITIGPRTSARPRRWPARLVALTTGGRGEIDIDLEPVETPPADWDGALSGSRGGLTITLLLRWTATAGQAQLDFSFKPEMALPVADQLAAAGVAMALRTRGKLEIHSRDGSRPEPMILQHGGHDVDPFFDSFYRFLGDVATIQEWIGEQFELPEVIERRGVETVTEIAYIIRNKKSRMNFGKMELRLDREHYLPFEDGAAPGPVRVETALDVRLFGQIFHLGYLVGEIPPEDIRVSAAPVEGADPPLWLVKLQPVSEAARSQVFRFQRESSESEGGQA